MVIGVNQQKRLKSSGDKSSMEKSYKITFKYMYRCLIRVDYGGQILNLEKDQLT
jgi:hypothetical protein